PSASRSRRTRRRAPRSQRQRGQASCERPSNGPTPACRIGFPKKPPPSYTSAMSIRPEEGGVRIAELVATMSYAADLGLGQPMAHCMRQTTIALRLADLAEATDDEREATYYLGLMMNVYCHADATEQARWFGDDIRLKADTVDIDDTARFISYVLRTIAS